jgi:hypothetical protein
VIEKIELPKMIIEAGCALGDYRIKAELPTSPGKKSDAIFYYREAVPGPII